MRFDPFRPSWAQMYWKGGPVPKASPAPPPVTERTTEVRQAQRDASRILRRRSAFINSTTLAGETGGGVNSGNQYGSSLLG